MKTYKVRIKKTPMKMGGFPRYQEGQEVPGQNEFDYGMMTDGFEPTRGSLKGSVTLAPVEGDYPLMSIPATGPVNALPAGGNNNSIYDFLVSQGKKADYASRKELAKSMGITNYTGRADQNLAMLDALRNGSAKPSVSTGRPGVVTKTPDGRVQVKPATQAPVAQAPEEDWDPYMYDPWDKDGNFKYTKQKHPRFEQLVGANYLPEYDARHQIWSPNTGLTEEQHQDLDNYARMNAGRNKTASKKHSVSSDITNALTGARSYEEYAKKNPYFFNFAGVNNNSSAIAKAVDYPFHLAENEIAKAYYNGDSDAIRNIISVAMMGRGAMNTTVPYNPGRAPRGYFQGPKQLPANNPMYNPRQLPGLRGIGPGGSLMVRQDGGEMDEMAYGGQIGYGFDLNTRRMKDNGPDPNSVARTLGPVDPEDATYEAEQGEVIVGDADKDGMNESMVFGGKRHYAGGTPANQSGFIYSRDKSLSLKGPIVEDFGKTAGSKKYTPADLAKQYDLNRYKKLIDDPNIDDLQKRTAQMMYDNYEKKLGKLAAVQESMKGFPQGTPELTEKHYPEMAQPEMAAYGGSYMQVGGTPKWLQPWTQSRTLAGRMSKTNPSLETTYNVKDGNTMVDDYNYWKGVAGREFTDPKDLQGFVFNNLIKSNKEGVNSMLGKYGYPNANNLADGILGARSAWALRQRMTQPGTPATASPTPQSITQTAQQQPAKDAKKEEAKKGETGSKDIEFTQSAPGQKTPYNAFDVMNLASAVASPVKSYGPRMFLPDVQEVQGYYDQPDYNPMLSAANTRAQMNNTFGNTGAAMAANSYNPDLTQGILQETNRARTNNLQTANQVSQANTQIRNQANTMNAQLMQDNYDKWVKTQEETDIANKLKWRQDVAPAAQNMVNNRINMERFNMMYPQYAVSGPFWDQINYQNNGYKVGQKAPSSSSGTDMATFLSQFPGMKALYESNDPAKKAEVEKEFMKFQNQQMMNMGRNPRNMYFNQNGYNPYLDDQRG